MTGPKPRGGTGQKPAYGTALSASIAVRALRPGTASVALLAALLAPVAVAAGGWSGSGSFDLTETAQIRDVQLGRPSGIRGGWGSDGGAGHWVALDEFERAWPGAEPPALSAFRLPSGSQVDQLFALIAFAEAPADRYDAVHHGARLRPGKPPSSMTLAEIHDWIGRTPGQPHAIGSFQIIPSTLLNLQQRLGLPDSTRFSRATQNRMAALLIADAGHRDFIAGRISRATYMDNLARIWAGLPLASGKSAYHGRAGNRATVTRAFFNRQMRRIFGSGESGGARVAGGARVREIGAPVQRSAWRRLGQ